MANLASCIHPLMAECKPTAGKRKSGRWDGRSKGKNIGRMGCIRVVLEISPSLVPLPGGVENWDRDSSGLQDGPKKRLMG